MEVKVAENGKEVWVDTPVTVNRTGEDVLGWTVNFEHNGTPYNEIPLAHTNVHAPFDFVALDHEMDLFGKKANVEGALIKAIRTNAYENLVDTVAQVTSAGAHFAPAFILLFSQ